MKELLDPAIRVWATMMLISLAFSGVVLFLGSGITGFAVYDSGPEVEFNPDYIGQEEYYSNTVTGLSVVLLLIVMQIGLYVGVNRYYRKIEEFEELEEMGR